MHLILPAAGQSTRFPNTRPKWMLTHPGGNMMVVEAIRGLNLADFESIHLGLLREHVEAHPCIEGIRQQFAALGVADKLKLWLLDRPTASQPETIATILGMAKLSGPIFCKDVDNYFKTVVTPGNNIAVSSLSENSYVNAANKSYAVIDHVGKIQNIVEKKIISEFFCVGGYGFQSAQEFLGYYEKLKDHDNLYVSDIIFRMLLDGVPFEHLPTDEYRDWGTLEDWNLFKREYATLFVDLDGTLVENGSEFIPPYWGETKAIAENVEWLNQCYDSGKTQIIITTSRGERWREATVAQLAREGIRYHHLMCGLFHAHRVVINNFATGSPYPAAVAVNLHRDAPHLKDYLPRIK